MLDWRKHVNFSSTILALLVALISVLTFEIPAIVKSLKNPRSDLNVSYVGSDDEAMNFLVTNKGSRPGVVTTGNDYLKYPDPIRRTSIAPMIPMRPTIVEPGQTVLITQIFDETWRTNVWGSIYEANRRVPGHAHICSHDDRGYGWVEGLFRLPMRSFDGKDSEFKMPIAISCGKYNCGWDDKATLFKEPTVCPK